MVRITKHHALVVHCISVCFAHECAIGLAGSSSYVLRAEALCGTCGTCGAGQGGGQLGADSENRPPELIASAVQ